MSSRRAIATAAIMATFALALGGGCADWSRGVAPPDAGEISADGGGGAFGTVHPLLVSGCRTCHSAEGEAGHTQFVLAGAAAGDYAAAVAFVDVKAPTSSRLLIKMSGAGHGGGAVFANGSPEYTAVLQWIREGALP